MDEDTTMEDHDFDNDNAFDDGVDRDEDGAPTTAELGRSVAHGLFSISPLSEDGLRGAMALYDDIARYFRESDEKERARAEEEREEARVREEAEERYRIIMEDRRARANEADIDERIEAAVRERLLRQELEAAKARAEAAEEALAASEPGHWASRLLREASTQHESHILATIEIAEDLGAARVDLERALRQHIAQRSVLTSRLALDLLINPLGAPKDALTDQARSQQHDPVA